MEHLHGLWTPLRAPGLSHPLGLHQHSADGLQEPTPQAGLSFGGARSIVASESPNCCQTSALGGTREGLFPESCASHSTAATPRSCVALGVPPGALAGSASRAVPRRAGGPGCLTQASEALGARDGARGQAVHTDLVGSPLHCKVTGHGIWGGIATAVRNREHSHASSFF